jgi:hypothetical protein
MLGIVVSAPFAIPVLDSQALQGVPPRSQLWVLLYVQAEQLDGTDRRTCYSPSDWPSGNAPG